MTAFVRRCLVVDAENVDESEPEPVPEGQEGRFTVSGGRSTRKTRKLVENVTIDGISSEEDVARLIDVLCNRIEAARLEPGVVVLLVRAYRPKGTSPFDTLRMDGSRDQADDGDAGEDLATAAQLRPAGLAEAQLARMNELLLAKTLGLVDQVVELASERQGELFDALGTMFEQRLQLAEQGGAYQAVSEAAQAVAPQLVPLVQVLAGAVLRYLEGEAARRAPPPPPSSSSSDDDEDDDVVDAEEVRPTPDQIGVALADGIAAAGTRLASTWLQMSEAGRAAVLERLSPLRSMLGALGVA